MFLMQETVQSHDTLLMQHVQDQHLLNIVSSHAELWFTEIRREELDSRANP